MIDHVDVLESAAARFAAFHERADPATPVPSCPGWTLADLLDHVIDVHGWARSMLTGEDQERWDDSDRVSAYRGAASDLVSALRERDPGDPCTAIYPPDVAGTWARRQALETSLHLWDATAAVGVPTSLQAELAADGVAEVVEDLYPRQVRLRRTPPLAAGVAFDMFDQGTVTLWGTDGLEARCTVRASAPDLLLVLWGRRRLDETPHRTEGDETALRAALDVALVP